MIRAVLHQVTRPYWARLDGAVILGLGWLMGAHPRIWASVALITAGAVLGIRVPSLLLARAAKDRGQ